MNIIQTSKGWNVINGDSHYSKWIEENGKLEDNFLAPLVADHLKEGDLVLDLGACYGDHSICYSRAVGKDGMVIAVEAGKMTFECLKSNIEQFPFKNVFPIHTCISEVCGNSISHETNTNIGASICKEVRDENRVVGHSYLMTTTIDFLVHQAQRKCNFIKMDIEGWELKALIGGNKTLREDKPGLLIEINPGALMLQGDTAEDIFELLDMVGYSWRIAQPEAKLGDPMLDIICFPK